MEFLVTLLVSKSHPIAIPQRVNGRTVLELGEAFASWFERCDSASIASVSELGSEVSPGCSYIDDEVYPEFTDERHQENGE